MVRLVNDSPAVRATLHVSGASSPVDVRLPAEGGVEDYFVDLRGAGAVVEASVDPGGDADADDRAWAVRSAVAPTVEVTGVVPEDVGRMIDIYRRHRPTGFGGKRVMVVPLGQQAATDQTAVRVVGPADAALTPLTGEVRWEEGPVTAGIDWNAAAAGASVAADPGGDWRRVVLAGDRTLVAVRTAGARQVWVGFQSPRWSTTPDFVVFWTKVLDWVGQGEQSYHSTQVRPLDPAWRLQTGSVSPEDNGLWPGVYGRGIERMAVNAGPVRPDPAPMTDWRARLAGLVAGKRLDIRTPGLGCWSRRWGGCWLRR